MKKEFLICGLTIEEYRKVQNFKILDIEIRIAVTIIICKKLKKDNSFNDSYSYIIYDKPISGLSVKNNPKSDYRKLLINPIL